MLSKRFIFILRGRPALGFVIPGLAIAQELSLRGHDTLVLTYKNGSDFLHKIKWQGWQNIEVDPNYTGWPGLDIYDVGLRILLPLIHHKHPDLVFFAGEYMLAPMGSIIDVPCCMMINPHHFELLPENKFSAALFSNLFQFCDFLIPLRPFCMGTVEDFNVLKDRILPAGPFRLADQPNLTSETKKGITVLISNGGGVDFSLSGPTERLSRTWINETHQMTRASVEGALNGIGQDGRVYLFSCLDRAWNSDLYNQCGRPTNLEVSNPSMEYFSILRIADVLIFRAGAGAVADALTTSSELVVWCLSEHTEHLGNATRLHRIRPQTYVAQNCIDLKSSINRAIIRAKNKSPQIIEYRPPFPNTKHLCDIIEDHLEKPCTLPPI